MTEEAGWEMIDEECLREINDGVFGLRDSLDRRIRQLGDIRRALDATECGLADMPVSYTHLDVYKRQSQNIHTVKR